jgi:hypothetical protein
MSRHLSLYVFDLFLLWGKFHLVLFLLEVMQLVS